METVIQDRMCAQVEGEPVVFLIGMRFNKPWKVGSWLPVFRAMPAMLRELGEHPELGCLSTRTWVGRTMLIVQYWESFDALEAYAKAPDKAHLPAWASFNRALRKSGDVGIWHETYGVKPGAYETMYVNMPAFGLAKATQAVPANTIGHSARQRLAGAEIGEPTP